MLLTFLSCVLSFQIYIYTKLYSGLRCVGDIINIHKVELYLMDLLFVYHFTK